MAAANKRVLELSSSARGTINHAIRALPRPGPAQSTRDAKARWFLEQAKRNLQLAEASWDTEEEPSGRPEA